MHDLYEKPLACVVVFAIMATLWEIALPLMVFFGYPALILSAASLVVRPREGGVERTVQSACLLAMHLGLLMFFHGAKFVMDAPSVTDKQFGYWLAYSGGGFAGISATAAYALDPSRRRRIR